MKSSKKNRLFSKGTKRISLAIAGIVVLFILLNNVILPWYVHGRGIVEVPPVTGRKYDEARELLDSLGLKPLPGDSLVDNQYPIGVVTIQNPAAGARVKQGRRIYLTISAGEARSIVPNIKGRTLRDAKFALEREGLRIGVIEYQTSDQFPEGTVIEQHVAPDKSVKRGQYVSVVVSQGPTSDKITVPNLSQKNLTEAEKVLTSLGLKVGNITYVPSPDLLPNTIVQQFPLGGDLVPFGQAVDLFVVQAMDKKKELFEN